MTTKKDINKRLGYTCNCGWIDKGHAKAGPSPDPMRGIYNLWHQLTTEKYHTEFTLNGRSCFLVQSRQEMQGLGGRIWAGESGLFLVRYGTRRSILKDIACRILLEVTDKFEAMQGSIPWSATSGASSFSLEDVTSNFIGLYAIINNVSMEHLLKNICKEVPKDESLRIWKEYFEKLSDGIGSKKYKRPVSKYNDPLFFPTNQSTGKPSFPEIFNELKPANYSEYFIPINLNITYKLPVHHFTFKNGKVTYKRDGDKKVHNMPLKFQF